MVENAAGYVRCASKSINGTGDLRDKIPFQGERNMDLPNGRGRGRGIYLINFSKQLTFYYYLASCNKSHPAGVNYL